MPARKITVSSSPATVAPTQIKLSLTNTARNDFLTCRRLYKLRYEEKLSLKAIPTPLLIGDIVHHGLAELMLGKSLDEALAVVRQQIAAARKKNLEDPEDFESDATIIEGMLRGWDQRRGQLKGASVWDWGGKKWVEQVFIWLLKDGTQITGKIDGVVVRPDGIWIVEHKTAARVDSKYIDRLLVDAQVSMYYWAVSKIYGKAPKGIIYNVLCKPGIRQRTKKDPESAAQFQTRLLNELLSEDKYYYSTQLFRDQRQVNEFERSLDLVISDIKLERQRDGWVMNNSQCTQIGRTCPMLSICANGRNNDIVNALYEVRKDLHPELA